MWEIFDPAKGAPIVTVPGLWLAKLLTRSNDLDFARRGDGWETEAVCFSVRGPLHRIGQRWGGAV